MTTDLKKIDIKKFNDYCAIALLECDDIYQVDGSIEFDPFNNMFQLASVVACLVTRTGKYPQPLVVGSDEELYNSWKQYILDVESYKDCAIDTRALLKRVEQLEKDLKRLKKEIRVR